MSNAIEKMITRRSIKKYKPDMVSKETIEKIVKAGTYAANGRGMQSPPKSRRLKK